jgi:hypothetical protein
MILTRVTVSTLLAMRIKFLKLFSGRGLRDRIYQFIKLINKTLCKAAIICQLIVDISTNEWLSVLRTSDEKYINKILKFIVLRVYPFN